MADSSFTDAFSSILGSLSDAYKEVVTADNASASPSSHDQTTTAVDATGAPVSTDSGPVSWLKANWLLLLVVAVVLIAFVMLIKLVI